MNVPGGNVRALVLNMPSNLADLIFFLKVRKKGLWKYRSILHNGAIFNRAKELKVEDHEAKELRVLF